MGISLVTFAGSTVTAQDDALVYETALANSGLMYGGAVSIKSANTLHVAAAHGALCGRKFTIEETDVTVPLTGSGTLIGRLYIHMDLADAEEPISLEVETGNSLTPVVQDANVNINNGVYEVNLATFTVDTSTIDSLVNVGPALVSFFLKSTLPQGNTTVTFNDARITTDSIIDIFSDVYGIAPTNVTVTSGQAVLTFDAQAQNVKVMIWVR